MSRFRIDAIFILLLKITLHLHDWWHLLNNVTFLGHWTRKVVFYLLYHLFSECHGHGKTFNECHLLNMMLFMTNHNTAKMSFEKLPIFSKSCFYTMFSKILPFRLRIWIVQPILSLSFSFSGQIKAFSDKAERGQLRIEDRVVVHPSDPSPSTR